MRRMVIVVASSGVAALILHGGRTAHLLRPNLTTTGPTFSHPSATISRFVDILQRSTRIERAGHGPGFAPASLQVCNLRSVWKNLITCPSCLISTRTHH
jgi:hypothetical protein